MKKSSSFKCILAIISMTALNGFLQVYSAEKTLNLVSLVIGGLVAIFCLAARTESVRKEYSEAEIILHRRYTLIKAIRVDNGHGKIEAFGAVLGFRDDKLRKQFCFFKNVRFAHRADIIRHSRFVAVKDPRNNRLILEPVSD